MRDISDPKSKSKMKQARSRWPKIGPLGRDAGQVFANLIYQDHSSPLTLTIVCTGQAIIILSDTEQVNAHEIDITVAGQALFLKMDFDDHEVYNQVNMSAPELAEAGIYKIPLMFEVDVTQIEAEYDNDLLHIQLPRLHTSQDHHAVNYIH